MYHIPNDKRSEQSAELIYHGLLDCIQKKHFDQITVSDLQRASGVARTTIYRSFDNISDILYWQCDTRFHEALFSFEPTPQASEIDLAQHYFKYWMTHSDILELLMKINRFDIIYACHMKNADDIQLLVCAQSSLYCRSGLKQGKDRRFFILRKYARLKRVIILHLGHFAFRCPLASE